MSDQVRARVWIDGELVVEEMFSTEAKEASLRHLEIVREAQDNDRRWYVVVDDPDDGTFMPLVFGTDTSQMLEPVEVTGPEEFRRAVDRHMDLPGPSRN